MLATTPLLFGIFDNLLLGMNIVWIIILALVAWYLYQWAQEHLAFSPTLAVVVAAILIYYLVFVYPIVGIGMWLFAGIMFSGIIWMLPMVMPFIPGLGKGGHH